MSISSKSSFQNLSSLKSSQKKAKNSCGCLLSVDFFMILMILSSFTYLSQQTLNPEDTMRFYEYATYYNYPVQEHIIKTSDNYNLKFFRIQQKNTKIQQLSGKPVVYLQHGLLGSSDTFIINEESLAPAFVFANKGFDVWVGNSRGNRYSSKALSPGVKRFWNFSFDQMAKYDLPAAFKYIASKTRKKIHYVGHSQGSLIMFIALSEKYAGVQENLLSFDAWGPVVYLTNMQSNTADLAKKAKPISGLISFQQHFFGYLPVLLLTRETHEANAALCRAAPEICLQLLGWSSVNSIDNLKIVPAIAGHQPSGTSLKNLNHFQQYVNTPIFRKYDYGDILGNQIIYGFGNSSPPKYDLSKITFPYVNLMIGKYDQSATMTDAERIWAEMSNVKHKVNNVLDYDHLTFIFGKSNEHIDISIKFMQRSLSGL